MVYASDREQLSMVEMAQGGHLPSLTMWLNGQLAPYRLRVRLSWVKPAYLRVVVELRPSRNDLKGRAFRNRLARFICHKLWILNSDVLDGAYIVAKQIGKPNILWKQSVRIVSPARKTVLARQAAQQATHSVQVAQTQQIHTRIRQASQQKKQFQTLRSLIISGSSAAAFIIGCWLGYADAPPEQTTASAKLSGQPTELVQTSSEKVKTALEEVPVIKKTSGNSDPAASLLFAGDVTLTESYTAKVGNDYHWAFAPFDEARKVDVSMVNLEAPFTTANQALPGKKATFKAPPENVQVLKNGGIDIVNLANNHTMDYEKAGLEQTIKSLSGAGIAHVGAGLNSQEARRPVIMDVKGQRIAYLGYYDADLQAASKQEAGTNPRRNDRVAEDIKTLRSQVDWIVVNYHWGDELAKYPGDWQIDLARFTIDQGADLVVGHHSQVLQGAEVYKGRPIVYSLGNFIFGGKSVSDYDTAALKVSLKDKQMKVELLPVQVRNYQAKVVSGDAGQQILQQVKSVSDIFQEPLASPMVIDAKTNQATPIESSKPSNSNQNQNENSPSKPAPASNSVTPKEPAKPLVEDPENPWNSDSFINPGNKNKPMTEEDNQGAAPTDDSSNPPTRKTKTIVAEMPSINQLEQESMLAGESPEFLPKSQSDSSTTTEATAGETMQAEVNEQPASGQTHDVQAPNPVPSLEPIQRRYAEVTSDAGADTIDPGSVTTIPANR
ncbi:CapA family protein [Alkalinema pantanalense CENA528]|uniref:CapA family protein n=1 Tax=Alkalinema pantanalense TaxID=1620705 RepID=UPI003D6FADE2